MSLREDEYALSEQRRREYNAAHQRKFRTRKKQELGEMREQNNKMTSSRKVWNLGSKSWNMDSDINTEPESEPANPIASVSKDEGDIGQNRSSYPIWAIRAAKREPVQRQAVTRNFSLKTRTHSSLRQRLNKPTHTTAFRR
ncbi:hypothetical protein EDB81DRAFT_768252 [Dactylonectria macrodidyma]|uniref:BZIP domain-containing protein n=1 Tax=Dactylonectria macrodidyma TaxID=307937 RepID=A0A9P9I9E9_9HYPO|nr:hypothetical protein EDB81DRAFT_768252 [Dactylonectria macrodidyma]